MNDYRQNFILPLAVFAATCFWVAWSRTSSEKVVDPAKFTESEQRDLRLASDEEGESESSSEGSFDAHGGEFVALAPAPFRYPVPAELPKPTNSESEYPINLSESNTDVSRGDLNWKSILEAAQKPKDSPRVATNSTSSREVRGNEAHSSGEVAESASRESTVNEELPPVLFVADSARDAYLNRIRYADSLVRRGAVFSAKEEYEKAIRDLAEHFNYQNNSDAYTRAVERGFRALEESKDFLTVQHSESSSEILNIAKNHRTPALHELADEVTTMDALQSYYTYSLDQFVRSSGRQAIAAEGFHALGRLHSFVNRNKGVVGGFEDEGQVPKAIVYHQVALNLNSSHDRSANELGVLLAELGQLNQAKQVLLLAARSNTNVEAWRNLATVHDRLREPAYAASARQQANHVARTIAPSSGVQLRVATNPNVNSQADRNIQNAPPQYAAQPSPQNGSTPGPQPRIVNQPSYFGIR